MMKMVATVVLGLSFVLLAACNNDTSNAGVGASAAPTAKEANDAALRQLGGGRTHVQTVKEMQDERREKR